MLSLQLYLVEEESRLCLLLCDTISELFVQVVNIQAEKRPITNSQSIGAQFGKKLKERIHKVLQSILTTGGEQTYSNLQSRTILLLMKNLPHSPWTIGFGMMFCTITPRHLGQPIQMFELEFKLLSRSAEYKKNFKFLRRSSWLISQTIIFILFCFYFFSLLLFQKLFTCVRTGVSVLAQGSEELPHDHLDLLHMGGLPRKYKCKLILREMRRHLDAHGVLMDCWCEGVVHMWDCCQPWGNGNCKRDWNKMIHKIRLEYCVRHGVVDGLDEEQEEVVLEAHIDDGEDAEGDLMSSMENVAQDGTRVSSILPLFHL
ncbi:hypothetical protein VP01_6819g1 [Puccinia sorghi]|uniref:Uncharacterized protein n=1 Tax=Puccinia sorghi TaxID=27349 RepID=A0A0L6UFB7_9BASI|nr:hypothetical protein VP01_6819g1 [Puccinia sorghi]